MCENWTWFEHDGTSEPRFEGAEVRVRLRDGRLLQGIYTLEPDDRPSAWLWALRPWEDRADVLAFALRRPSAIDRLREMLAEPRPAEVADV